MTMYVYSLLALLLLVFLLSAIKVLREYERGVVFLLGRFYKVKGPGLFLLVPIVQQMVKVDLRTVTMDVPTQDVISRDNVSVKVDAIVFFRVVEPAKAINQVEQYYVATSQLAQTTLRSVLGSTNWTRCWPSGRSSTSTSSPSWTSRPTPGASRSPTWKSSGSIWTRAWCGPSPARPRRSGSGGPRSSMPWANCRRRKNW